MIDKMIRPSSLLICGLVLSPAGAAFASGGGEAPGLFSGNLGNVIWTLITFLAVVFVLGKFAWGPILNGLKSREEFISKSIKDAEDANNKAAALLAEHEKKMDEARAEASAIVEEGRRDAEVVRKELQAKAKAEADAMLERAKREIGIARDTAVRDLYELGSQLATDVASKIIAKELNPADHQRLVQESIDELNKIEPGNN